MSDIFKQYFNDLKSEITDDVIDFIKTHLEEKKMNQKEFYTLKEFSYKTGLNKRQITYRHRNGKLKFVYDGTTPLIPTKEVERFIKVLNNQIKSSF
jgi:hypothetical protein